jgi:hypothetical protein
VTGGADDRHQQIAVRGVIVNDKNRSHNLTASRRA